MFVPDLHLHFRESLLNPKSFNETLLNLTPVYLFLQQARLTFERDPEAGWAVKLAVTIKSILSDSVYIALILRGGNRTVHGDIWL